MKKSAAAGWIALLALILGMVGAPRLSLTWSGFPNSAYLPIAAIDLKAVTPTATSVVQTTPTSTATPSPTVTASPTATSAPPTDPYVGTIVQTFHNCGLTQVFGIVLDQTGQHLPGTRVRLWWSNQGPLHAVAGNYLRPETGASGWDFTLNSRPVANTWYVAIEDQDQNQLLSQPVEVRTVESCGEGDANVVKVQFTLTAP